MDGKLGEEVVNVHQPIGQFQRGGQRFMRVDPDGKPASTTFRLLQHYGNCSFVEATLHTGHTHQIRAHAAHLEAPLAGDKRYSPDSRQRYFSGKGCKRLFLHAHELKFRTRDGEEQLVSSGLPDELSRLLERLS